MDRDTVSTVTERPVLDYAHLPGEEENPLMESTAHVDWGLVLLNSARHALAGTGHLVTGNVPFAPADGEPHTAPDVMVIPGAAGREFGRYEPGPNDPLPSACVEILSPSNTVADIQRRCRRLLRLGVAEVYVLDPRKETVVRVEFDGDVLRQTSAIGVSSPGLGITFTLSGRHLAVCCPAGRIVRPGDDPFGWLMDETNRADEAERRVDQVAARAMAGEHRAQLSEAKAETAEARAETAEARAETEARRAQLLDVANADLRARVAALEAARRESGRSPN
jgi:Uma2 family endonuclease